MSALAPEIRPASAQWPLWGGYAFVAVERGDLLDEARGISEELLATVDLTCSRFRGDSNLSHANRHAGRWVEAHPLLVAATRVAVAAAEETDGLVDPCLGRTMVSLGYDVTLGELTTRPTHPAVRPVAPRPGAWREVGTGDDAVRVPPGVALDLGATAKAWTADLLARMLVDALGCAVVVSLAGDVRVDGPGGPDGRPATWPVRIAEHPHDAGSGPEVRVSGGLATSSTVARRWTTTAGAQHHLVDPRTGAPADGPFRTVSAVGHSCVAANVATTAALVLGEDAPAWLADRGVSARLVTADGAVVTTGDWPESKEGL
jgi:FAD:protein FMN transferase